MKESLLLGIFYFFHAHVQLCPTVYNPMAYSLPGSFVHGIVQASILKQDAISCSRGPS